LQQQRNRHQLRFGRDHHPLFHHAEQIYAVISRFDNLTPAVADRVEEWQATEETCSFKAKGFTVKLRMEERIEPRHVKIVGDDGVRLSKRLMTA
jgi:hypothetical protein